jgi:hypothetical protein
LHLFQRNSSLHPNWFWVAVNAASLSSCVDFSIDVKCLNNKWLKWMETFHEICFCFESPEIQYFEMSRTNARFERCSQTVLLGSNFGSYSFLCLMSLFKHLSIFSWFIIHESSNFGRGSHDRPNISLKLPKVFDEEYWNFELRWYHLHVINWTTFSRKSSCDR